MGKTFRIDAVNHLIHNFDCIMGQTNRIDESLAYTAQSLNMGMDWRHIARTPDPKRIPNHPLTSANALPNKKAAAVVRPLVRTTSKQTKGNLIFICWSKKTT